MIIDAEDHDRKVLLEAFTAGWQAGLAVTITNPRVLAVVENCFDMWLQEAVDEVDVLGLPFRGRTDLPVPSEPADWPVPGPGAWAGSTRAAARAAPEDTGRRHTPGSGSPIPAQRLDVEAALDGTGEPQRRPAANVRRLLARAGGRGGPKHRDVTARHD